MVCVVRAVTVWARTGQVDAGADGDLRELPSKRVMNSLWRILVGAATIMSLVLCIGACAWLRPTTPRS